MKTPPGPSGFLFGIPQVLKMRRDILAWFAELQSLYGDIISIPMGPFRYVLVFEPNAIKEVLTTKAKNFERSPRVRAVLSQWNGKGLILAEGEAWAKQRRSLQQAFTASKFDLYEDLIGEHVDRMVAQLPTGKPVDVEREMTDLTLSVICQAMFGEALSNHKEVGEAVAILSIVSVHELESPFTTPDWIPTPWKKRKRWAMKVIDDLVWDFIRKRRSSGEDKGDLLSKLLLEMSDVEVRDESVGMLLAGHDTTAAGLIWILYNLALDTEIQKRARGDAKYLECVVKESLRLYPPAIGVFQRIAVNDIEIGGFHIAKGSLIQPMSYVTQRDARWFPEPLKFKPERFLEEVNPFAYFPFGAGPRACIGRNFAMLEMQIVTRKILERFSLKLSDPNFKVVLQPNLSLRPKEKVFVEFYSAE